MTEINFLLVFMIAAAVIAIQAEDLISSVIGIGAVGIGLSMTFLVLRAPDLAILQLVVEIICLIVLISATVKRDLPFSTSGRWYFNTFSTFLFIAVFLFFAYAALKGLPRFGEASQMRVSAAYLEKGFQETGELNIVSAITHHFRRLDTLCETVIVFTALVGVLAIARRKAKE